LASVDLPTFGRPASAMNPERVCEAWLTRDQRTQRISSAWSASISPLSVSWSIPVR
jgi:hypothetical protein